MRRVGGFLLALFALCLWAIILTLGYFTIGTHRVPFASRLLQHRLDRTMAPQKFDDDGIYAHIGWNHGLRVELALENARLLDGEKILFTASRIGAEFGVRSMLRRHWKIGEVAIQEPKIDLSPAPEDDPLPEKSGKMPSLMPQDVENLLSNVQRVGKLVLLNGEFTWRDGAAIHRWSMPAVELNATRDALRLNARFTSALDRSAIGLELDRDLIGEWNGHWRIEKLPAEAVAAFLPANSNGKGATGTVTGVGNFHLSSKSIEFHSSASLTNGSYENKKLFPEKLPVTSFNISADGRLQEGNFDLSHLEASLASGAVRLGTTGSVKITPAGPTADLDLTIAGMVADQLPNYWPLVLAPNSRNWVITHVTAGNVPKALGAIHLRPEDMHAASMPARLVSLDIPLENGTVSYLSNMPDAENVKALIHLDGVSLHVEIASANSFKASAVGPGSLVEIKDFNDRTLPLHLLLKLSGPASDVAQALSPRHLNIGTKLGLDPALIQGSARGLLDLHLILFPEAAGPVQDAHTQVNYALQADLFHITQDHVLDKWNVGDMNGHFWAVPNGFVMNGNAVLQGVSGLFAASQTAVPNRVEYGWKALIPTSKMAEFGPHLPAGISGVIGMDAHIVDEKNTETVKAAFDLADADLSIDDLRYRKPAGMPASLTMTHIETTGDAINRIPRFEYRSGKDELSGAVSLQGGTIVSAYIPTVRLQGSDLSARYGLEGSNRVVILEGKRLDESPWWQEKHARDEANDDPFAPMHDLDLTVKLGEVAFGENSSLLQARGHVICGPNLCSSASFDTVSVHQKPISLRIESANGLRHLAMQAADSGELLNILQITQRVIGGDLTYEGSFDDTKPDHPLAGHVLMNDFRIQNAPILTKLLTLVSFTGMADTVRGKGIRFDRLSGDVTYSRGNLLLKKMRASGPAIGIVAEGAVENGEQLALIGTLIPSYTANSLLGRLPLIGNALVGGEGQGVLGIRFKVQGSVGDPEVSANPLSLLTPGFLRNIFSIGDDKPEEAAAALEKQQARKAKSAPVADAPAAEAPAE